MTTSVVLSMPFAHSGHVLVDLTIYLGPVVAILLWLKIADWRKKRARKKHSTETTPRGGDGERRGRV